MDHRSTILFTQYEAKKAVKLTHPSKNNVSYFINPLNFNNKLN